METSPIARFFIPAGMLPGVFLWFLVTSWSLGCSSTPAMDDLDEVSTTSSALDDLFWIEPADPSMIGVFVERGVLISFPDGSRQLDQKYWLGAMIEPDEVQALKHMGIRLVLSAVQPHEKTLFLLDAAGIEHVSVPMGRTFRYADRILEAIGGREPSEIFIHCRHGADRTGVIAAYILVMRHKWPASDALFAVLNPAEEDYNGLRRVLRGFGIQEGRELDDPLVGRYSLVRAGLEGGLKVRNRHYRRLVRSALEQMISPVSTSSPGGR
ncbi:MAG: tyrosine-protein phosphatase [Bradymonadales bacterium]|nr:tyrosine-protein phosphatase [Bradymonadales bacterium]